MDGNSRDDRNRLISEGTRWLLEMEVLNIPHMKNAMILNIYKVSSHIQNAELLIDEKHKKMLIYLQLSAFGRLFKKRQISQDVLDMIQEVLPSFQLRVVLDLELFLKALKGLRAHVEQREAKIAELKKKQAEAKKAKEAETKSKPTSDSQGGEK